MSWLADKPALSRVVSRIRTHEARAEMVHAVLDGAEKPPAWAQDGMAWRAFDATRALHVRIGSSDPDVLIEAALWDDDIAECCWSEVHERCCNETHEHSDDAWREALGAILDDWPRPAFLTSKTYQRLRRRAKRAEATDRWHKVLSAIENDNELCDQTDEEGTRRHMEECVRGSVGGNFHSVP